MSLWNNRIVANNLYWYLTGVVASNGNETLQKSEAATGGVI